LKAIERAEEAVGQSRRERKKRATRLALKAAALRLVAERGYAQVTVEDIAEAVDVSVRTFFNYFPSKEAAVVGGDPDLLTAVRERLLSLPAELAPLEALREVLLGELEAMLEDAASLGEDHDAWTRRFAAVRSQPEVMAEHARFLAATEEYLAEALLERLGGDERLRGYAAIVTTCALGALRTVGMLWGRQGGTSSLSELARGAFDLLAKGLVLDCPSLGGGAPALSPAAPEGKEPALSAAGRSEVGR
jgi:AcrR family transcriptional regulator